MFASLHRPLRPQDLIERATRSSGFADFGDTAFREGLQVFLRASSEEADLSLFGYFGTRWDVRRFLTNLLRLRHEELRAPKILEIPIERPVFITGMPRSGTSFLQRLLTADKTNRTPRVWQAIHPYPALRARKDRRQRHVARQLRMFDMLAPEFRSMHPIKASSPQECSDITAHVFASLRFDTTYSIPSYRRWLAKTGHLDAYRFHKRFLQHLQHQERGAPRWVLKCPDHVFALDAIQAVYPDARVVFVHRDPSHVIASVARLTEILRKPFSRHVNHAEIGRQEVENWSAASDLMISASNSEPFAEPIFHVNYQDLVSDPYRVVKTLYGHFGLDFDRETQSGIIRIFEDAPNGGYGINHLDFERYGIAPSFLRERFAPYISRFAVPTTPGPNKAKASPF